MITVEGNKVSIQLGADDVLMTHWPSEDGTFLGLQNAADGPIWHMDDLEPAIQGGDGEEYVEIRGTVEGLRQLQFAINELIERLER